MQLAFVAVALQPTTQMGFYRQSEKGVRILNAESSIIKEKYTRM